MVVSTLASPVHFLTSWFPTSWAWLLKVEQNNRYSDINVINTIRYKLSLHSWRTFFKLKEWLKLYIIKRKQNDASTSFITTMFDYEWILSSWNVQPRPKLLWPFGQLILHISGPKKVASHHQFLGCFLRFAHCNIFWHPFVT